MPARHESGPEDRDQKLGLERIIFFSDAVMAIAITLLAVDVRVPDATAVSAPAELPPRLLAMLPKL